MRRSKKVLVPHNPDFRRTWMFPRNIRHIAPWKIAQIVTLLWEQAKSTAWSGNQTIQGQFTKALELAGLKRVGVQYDPHSGGARTYLAQLECLGLVFKRGRREVYLTLAGEGMAGGSPPLPILQELLFRHQYPSVYSQNKNVKIHPSVKVKPFLFVLELMKLAGYLTNEELVVPIVYGHSRQCLDLCLGKIEKLRRGQPLESVIDYPDDLYTPRTRGRSESDAIADVRNIANTCKNYLDGGCLIDVESEDGRHKARIANEYSKLIFKAINRSEDFISGWESEESFQRKLGCWGRSKDTRLISEMVNAKPSNSIIAARFFSLAGTAPILSFPDEFTYEMVSGFGFAVDEIKEVINPLLGKALDYFESTYMDMAKSGGVKSVEFEKATGRLFTDRLKFSVQHTGQKKRLGQVGGYADLFLIALDDSHCAIIDTKSTSSYSLNAQDYRAMAYDYIPSYMELSPDKNRVLEFCSYVAGGYAGNINSKLKALREKTGVPVSAISALNMLNICKADLTQDTIREVFSEGRKLDCRDFNR